MATKKKIKLHDWKQYIIVNQSLKMPPGKLAEQVASASMAFLRPPIENRFLRYTDDGEIAVVEDLYFDRTLYDKWLTGRDVKVCLGVKDGERMQTIVQKLREEGFREGFDFFRVLDGDRWSAIGIRPMDSDDDKIKRVIAGLRPVK